MRGLSRRWIYRRNADAPHGDEPLPARVLAARGVSGDDAVRRFFEPKLTDLHDPSLIPGLDAAAERLMAAVREQRRIVIYGDYDVDGMTATAILFHMVKAVSPEASISGYVPHRLEEGYGINSAALRQISEQGADMVVSVDCGITAVEPARVAASLGLELIITDHHNPPDEMSAIPPANVVVHPRLPGSTYPFDGLCGAGVAYKLAWRFATMWCGTSRVSDGLRQVLLDTLTLAALGTIADVVPLTDENRTIATYGLRWIKRTPYEGLRALLEASDLMDERIDATTVGFILGPRLNACGRMGHAAEALHLLTEARGEEARVIAERLITLNKQRQQTERQLTAQATRLAQDAGMTAEGCRAIVLSDPEWHAGVLGIACSRLAERFGRPTILLRDQGDVLKGSGRSAAGYSLHGGLVAQADLLEQFGGHDAAVGLTVTRDRFDAFVEAFTLHANRHISADELTPALKIDCDARIEELTFESVGRIAALAPFGHANPRPQVRLQDLVVTEAPRPLGAHGRHIALRLRSAAAGGPWLRAVWFGGGEHLPHLAAGQRLDVVIEPKLNTYLGKTTVEGVIGDVSVSVS